MNQKLTYQFIDKRIRETGMICRGGFHPEPDDNIPIQGQTCIMIGNAGHQFWTAFEAARFDDNNPLHCWTGSTLTTAAEELGGKVFFRLPDHPFYPSSLGHNVPRLFFLLRSGYSYTMNSAYGMRTEACSFLKKL